MMSTKFKVLFTNKFPAVTFDLLKASGLDLDVKMWPGNMERRDLIEQVKHVDALICTFRESINQELVDAAEKLKVVSTLSAGLDHIDTTALKRRGIRLGYTPNALTEACADFTVALTLATLRRFMECADAVKSGEWNDSFRLDWLCGKSIYDCKVGLFGMGRIGQAIVKRLIPFNPRSLLYSSRSRKVEFENQTSLIWRENLDEMLKEVDVLLICCELNEYTRGLFNKQRMELMKPDSYLINISRGLVVDQEGLVELLEKGHFAGVGLDVTTPEPLPTNHALLKFPRCLVMPHHAGVTTSANHEMVVLTVKNAISALKGEKMPDEFL